MRRYSREPPKTSRITYDHNSRCVGMLQIPCYVFLYGSCQSLHQRILFPVSIPTRKQPPLISMCCLPGVECRMARKATRTVDAPRRGCCTRSIAVVETASICCPLQDALLCDCSVFGVCDGHVLVPTSRPSPPDALQPDTARVC